MVGKICNNKVVFSMGGNELKMRLSDFELKTLRHSSIWYKGDNWQNMTRGRIHNFAIYALLDYDWKSTSKRKRFFSAFPYDQYDMVYWYLE